MDNMQMDGGQMDQSQGGYCIEIYVGADGKPTSVNVETMDEESAEDQGGMQAMQGDAEEQQEPQGGDKGVPVASMEEAMSMVHQIIQNQGQMPQDGAQGDQGNAMDEIMQGYGKGGIAARHGGLPVRKVFSGGM